MELTNHGIGKRALALLLTAVLALSLCAMVMETRAEETYTVTFDANGGVFPEYYTNGKNPAYTWDGSTLKIKVTAGEQTVFPFVEKKGRTGYFAFDRWGVTGAEYKMGAKTPQINSDITYKAFWGEEGNSTKVEVKIVDGYANNIVFHMPSNGNLYVPENPYPPSTTRKFTGWDITITPMFGSESNLKKGIGEEGDKIPLGSFPEKVTIKAVWEKIETQFLVKYHYNPPAGCEDIGKTPGVWSSNDGKGTVTLYYFYEAPYGMYDADFTPPIGYKPLGWSEDPDALTATYSEGQTITVSKNTDLYAIWQKVDVSATISNHYLDENGEETGTGDVETVNLPLWQPLDDYEPTDKTKMYSGKSYIFQKAVAEGKATEAGPNKIDVYYDIDTLSDENDTTTEADGIADKYQRTVTYKVENGTWADETTGDKTEVVTLMNGEEYSKTGTAQLTVPALGEPGNGNLEGRWSTVDGKAPTSVTASGPFEYTYHFLDKDEAIVIQPAEVHVTYDGTEHTFREFTATKLSGEPWPNIMVELKQGADLAGCGWTDATESGGVTIDLNRKFSENNVNWKDIFDIKGLDAGQENNVTFGTGTIIIDPCPVEVELNVTELTELKAGIGSGKEGDKPVKPTYKYDQADKELIAEFVFDGYEHTISLDPTIFNITDSEGNKVKVKLAPDDGSTTITLSATKVGDAVDATLDLTSAALELADAGADADNYTVGSSKAKTISRAPIMNSSNEEEITDLTGKEVEKISIRIIPRPVSYWTYGGAKIYDGAGIPKDENYTTSNMNHPEENNETKMDPEKKDKHVYIGEPRYEEIVKYDGKAIGKDVRGFVVRGTTAGDSSYTTLNHRPWKVESECPIDVGIKDTEVTIVEFGNEYVKVDVMNDYAIEYHNGYYAIYPQSITDNPQFYDSGFDTIDTFKDASYDDKVIEYTYKDRDAKTAIPSAEELTAFYTGVKLTDDFAEAYPYDGKPHIAEAGALRNDNNAEGKQDLTEGTDYTVTYYRQDDKGAWSKITEEEDFVEPGKIKIVYQGIGNYRNRIEKEYSIVSGNGGLIPPDPPTPGGPDVEVDDHDHYAYIIGKPGGIVDPNGEITRAEIATVIFRLLKEEVREQYWSKENSFPDVEITDWYNNAVSTLEKLGVVEGKDDGLFHPDDPITRAEMATMMVRLYDYDVDTGGFHTKFDDVDPAAWYARYVAAAEELALFLGDGSTSHFYPDRSLTRAEAMTVYNRLLGRKPHKDGLLPEAQMILWPDNMDATAWYYADVQEATNSHTCVIDGLAVGGERFERWLSPLPVRDWAALEQAWSEAHSGYDGHDVN